ncbi:MAG: hypothetical protein EXX96DRAFT_528729 [Benjaminiella poitrasii]|nr:MAG: hypothetical protein EXX96DRAFT_528729 [Benjaminiella poitrasii]
MSSSNNAKDYNPNVPKSLLDLSFDLKLDIMNYLDNRSLARLAQTCTYFGMLVRSILSFRKAQVSLINQTIPSSIPFLNFRAGSCIGSKFYLPFINDTPHCYVYDLTEFTWSYHRLNLIDVDHIKPQITSSAVISQKIYLACGRLLHSYILSNGLIEIDTTNFNTRVISAVNGLPPRPRHEHSVDAVSDRYLVVFGGLCYNSVGENDVFVYDTLENRWFVPPITGHVPHLRFGHASAVIGTDLYIHGGSQIDVDSTYIVYDDLYKLDCQTWTWYKYEHPEVERYLRHQIRDDGTHTETERRYLISTNGDNPYDRFQACMCAYGAKLIVFGGHSIREDEDENEILCSYPIDELSIFNTRKRAWTLMRASTKPYKTMSTGFEARQEDEEGDKSEQIITVTDVNFAIVPLDSRGLRIFILAGQKSSDAMKLDEPYDTSLMENSQSPESSKRSSNHLPSSHDSHDSHDSHILPHISDTLSQRPSKLQKYDSSLDSDLHETEEAAIHNSLLAKQLTNENDNCRQSSSDYETRQPTKGDLPEKIIKLFRAIDNDITDVEIEGENRDFNKEAEIIERNNQGLIKSHVAGAKESREKAGISKSNEHDKKRKPSTFVIHRAHQSQDNIHDPQEESSKSNTGKDNDSSSSSKGTYDSNSSNNSRRDKNKRSSNKEGKVTPCLVLLELLE